MSTMNMTWPESIGFLRHADSIANASRRARKLGKETAEQRLYRQTVGDHNIDLTEIGELQATAAGEGIRKRFPRIDAAFHSGYIRNEKTLRKALRAAYGEDYEKHIPVSMDLLLREREPGRPHTMDFAEECRTFPWWPKFFKMNGRMFSKPDGGESIATGSDRFNIFLTKLRLGYAGKRVFLGMHGRMIGIARMILEDWTIEQMEEFVRDENPERPKNAGLTVYQYCPVQDKMVLSEYNVPCGYRRPEAA